MTYGWSIEVPPRRIRTWHCECEECGCETSTESDAIPTACPFERVPRWRCG